MVDHLRHQNCHNLSGFLDMIIFALSSVELSTNVQFEYALLCLALHPCKVAHAPHKKNHNKRIEATRIWEIVVRCHSSVVGAKAHTRLPSR